MHKRLIGFLLSFFMVCAAGVGVADDVYLTSGHVPSYSCTVQPDGVLPNSLLSSLGPWAVNMVPVYEPNCSLGYTPAKDLNGDYTGCNLITDVCYPGEYFDVDESAATPCPVDHYCDFNDASGITCSIENAGGPHECPEGTTTTLNPRPTGNEGRGATSESQCQFRICNPGEKAVVENGVVQCAPCDENHYCPGGTYGVNYVGQSMQECPTKIVAGEGTSSRGSFRCQYTCPKGKTFVVRGAWFSTNTDCEPCPLGYYCPESTTYPEQTTYDLQDASKNQDVQGYHGAVKCEGDLTTANLGSESADACNYHVKSCDPGEYLNVSDPNDPKCESCVDNNKIEDNEYCPGGNLANTNNDPERVGVQQCDVYDVQQVVGGVPTNNTSTYISWPNATRTACVCAEGYMWNSETRACCKQIDKGAGIYEADFCCAPGYRPYLYADGRKECHICSSEDDEGEGFCTGEIITVSEICNPFDAVSISATSGAGDPDQAYSRGGARCNFCPANAKPNDTRTSCICHQPYQNADYEYTANNSYNASDNEQLVYWDQNASVCKNAQYRVYVYYTDIHLDNTIWGSHGYSSGNSEPYWSKNYTYTESDFYVQLGGNVQNNRQGYYLFTDSVKERDVNDGFNDGSKVFAGWCRDVSFCCPANYRVVKNGNQYKCQPCVTGNDSNECKGLNYTAPDEDPHLSPATDPNDRQYGIRYTAMFLARPYECAAGEYLVNLECKPCPAGYYCEGGTLSVSNDGKTECEIGTYNELTGQSDASACLSCSNLYDGQWQNLTTVGKATDSASKCGYYCEPTKYAADNTYECNQSCTAGDYCPGGGYDAYYGRWYNQFYTLPGKGKYPCPTGLTSDAEAKSCYQTCETAQYIKRISDWPNATYQCVDCDEDDYYCVGGKLGLTVFYTDITQHNDSNGKNACGTNYSSKAPASRCYLSEVDEGQFINQFGEPGRCTAGSFCDGVSGEMKPCPDGSVSNDGASKITDCKCLSDVELEAGAQPQYRPNGVYDEKGAGLYNIGTENAPEYVCVNTYLTVENTEAFTQADETDFIDGLGAKIVSCQWETDPNSTDKTVGKYSKCTERAVKICHKSIWNNEFKLWQHDDGVHTQPVEDVVAVLNRLARDIDQPLSGDIFKAILPSDISLISDNYRTNDGIVFFVDEDDNCNSETECLQEFVHLIEHTCKAKITYDLGTEEAWEPTYYNERNLPMHFANPTREYYDFAGWCIYDSDENNGANCTVNDTENYVAPQDENESVVAVAVRSSGDKWAYARWTATPYSIQYDLGGGTVATNNPVSYTIETDTFTLTNPTKTGYIFDGWCVYNSDENTGKDCENVEQTITIATGSIGDKWLYATWTPIKYNIEFNANGADSGTMSNMINLEYDHTYSLTQNGYEKENSKFAGWCDDSFAANNGCTGHHKYADGASVSNLTTENGATVVLYAVWRPKSECASGKWLHVGDAEMCLYTEDQKPEAKPRLVIMIGNTKYYAHMSPAASGKPMSSATDKKLHVEYNGNVYNVHDLTTTE